MSTFKKSDQFSVAILLTYVNLFHICLVQNCKNNIFGLLIRNKYNWHLKDMSLDYIWPRCKQKAFFSWFSRPDIFSHYLESPGQFWLRNAYIRIKCILLWKKNMMNLIPLHVKVKERFPDKIGTGMTLKWPILKVMASC